jgi:hypothetical protein
MSSPFLVVDSPQIVCVSEPDQAITKVVVRGRWDSELRQDASRVLRACVAAAPRVLLVDLAWLQDPAGESVSTWHTTTRYALQADRQVMVVLAAAPPAVRQRLSTDDGHPAMVLADTADAALAVVPSPDGGIRRHHLALPGHPTASALARRMVSDTCLAFDVAHLAPPARLIVSELVTNAVLHTGTDLDRRGPDRRGHRSPAGRPPGPAGQGRGAVRFVTVDSHRLCQRSAPVLCGRSGRGWVAGWLGSRTTDTPLQLISDAEYAAGVARLHAAAEQVDGPVIDALDLLALR